MSGNRPVVLFCGGLAADGVARNTVHLANALARRGVAVEVICLEGGALARELRGPSLTCLGRGRGPRGLSLAVAVAALRARIVTLDPAVAVSMGNHAHLPLWAALRARPDIPRIYRISNDPAHDGRRGLRGLLRHAGLGLIAGDATRLVCVSQALSRLGAFRRARRDGRVVSLANGVDVARVRASAGRPTAHSWAVDARPYLVAVGRVHPQKNYGALIRALARLHASGRPDLRLLILGKAPAAHTAPLRRLARELGVASAVRFEGETADPFPIVARAAAFVLPSLWEGASNSLLEALACGAPVVAGAGAGNAAEVLGQGRFGRLADARDPDALADAIGLQLDPRHRVLPGGRAETFDLEAVLDRMCAIVLGARSAHDEIQIRTEGARQPPPLSDPLRGPNTEF
ncbi:glycosyltransferase [Phenylobacterium sp. SCN 70-31]|uniref:glycosyltransferase n=1 Tax=Phenylobacterium sp. SCN 70-31 TaxID=1660129 RepID=UPI0025E0CF3E|nr:glycosyltransferase [Phenylobacterium sp. SCN 70-31]